MGGAGGGTSMQNGAGAREGRVEQSMYLVQMESSNAGAVKEGEIEEGEKEEGEGEASCSSAKKGKGEGGEAIGVGLGGVPDLRAVLQALSSTPSSREYAYYSHDLDHHVIKTVIAARSPTFGQGGPGPLQKGDGVLDVEGEEELPAVPGPGPGSGPGSDLGSGSGPW